MKRLNHCVLPVIGAMFVLEAGVGAACANTQPDLVAEIDKIFSWVAPDCPGCSVAASKNGTLVISRAYGLADLERGLPITADSIFDAGSIQKQFVAAAALLLVEDGKFALTDDVRTYIPELPDYAPHRVTIDQLLTHTAGLRDWTGLLRIASGEPDVLPLLIRQRGLNFPPGEEFLYSNSGIVLAKEIIARVSGLSFADFARTRIFEPLGMMSTRYQADMREVIKDRALAYQKSGAGWRTAMLLDNDRGGGGILTTAADLVKWSDALAGDRLGQFVSRKMIEPTTLNNGRTLTYARGLFLESASEVKTVWHGGSADGYQSVVIRFPEYQMSIAIMCNAGDLDQSALAGRVFDVLVPSAPHQPAEGEGPPPVIPEGMDLSAREGLYISEHDADPLRLTIDRGRFRIASGPGLVPVTDSRFQRWGRGVMFMSGDAFELTFTSPDQFELKSMEGKITTYRRAKGLAPSEEDLKAFAGRYHNDEVGAVMQIAAEQGGLVGRLEHSPQMSLRLQPVDRDMFLISRMVFRFVRDSSGAVVAIDYSNPAVRNLKFTRLDDLP